MCGIVGYTGGQAAAPLLLEGLSRLEYRGYDSAGLAVRDGEQLAVVVKSVGKLRNLSEKTDGGRALPGCCGIGHTRWATHGEPNQINAHPHVSGNCVGSASGPVESAVVGVHNGIIENFAELKDKLLKNGYQFYSQTDTEVVVVKLVDYYYKKYKIGPIDAINRMMVRVRGSYALALMFRDYPGEIYTARKDSPLIIGLKENEAFLATAKSLSMMWRMWSVSARENPAMTRCKYQRFNCCATNRCSADRLHKQPDRSRRKKHV